MVLQATYLGVFLHGTISAMGLAGIRQNGKLTLYGYIDSVSSDVATRGLLLSGCESKENDELPHGTEDSGAARCCIC
jgi:hypothetical protein